MNYNNYPNQNENWNQVLNSFNQELSKFHKESKKIQDSINLLKAAIPNPKYQKPRTQLMIKSKIKAIETSQNEVKIRFESFNPFIPFDYYYTFDYYHNKTLDKPFFSVTQLFNTNSNTKMNIELVWKKEAKDHTKKSSHPNFEQFLIYLADNNIDYEKVKFHSDREPSWVKLKTDIKNDDPGKDTKVSKECKFKQIFIDSESFNLLLTKGAKDSCLKEPCQPYDEVDLDTEPLRENSKALLYTMILKQIKTHNTNLFNRLNSDTFLYKLRKNSTGN